MGYHHNGISILAADILDQFQNILGRAIVQRTGRLIAKQDVRILDDGSADGRSLLLTAGKLVGQLMPVFVQPQGFQKIVHIQR